MLIGKSILMLSSDHRNSPLGTALGSIGQLLTCITSSYFTILNVLLLCRYEKQVKDSLEYFESLRQAQLLRGGENMEKTFLAHETWRNLRISCRGFFAYCREMIRCADEYGQEGMIQKFHCVSPAHSNSSPIEAWFSVVRASRQDSATSYAALSAGRDMTKAQATAALTNNKMYMAGHIGGIEEGAAYIGPAELVNFHKHREKQMKAMIDTFNQTKPPTIHRPRAAYSTVDLPTSLLDYEKDVMDRLLTKKLQCGYLPQLLQQEYFQQCMRLSIDNSTEKWFVELLAIAKDPAHLLRFENACTNIQDKLFQISLRAMKDRKNNNTSHEYDLHAYHRSSEFDDMCVNALPGTLGLIHPCCAMLCIALNRLHLGWLREALIDARKERNPEMFAKAATSSLTTAQKNSEVNRFVGWAIFSTMKKFHSRGSGGSDNDKECRALLAAMMLRAWQMDDEYVNNYYDITVAMRNCGGLTLVSKLFFEWGKMLLETIRSEYNTDAINLDPKNAFEKAKESIMTNKQLQDRFVLICLNNKMASAEVARKVWTICVRKTIHARCAAVFRHWKEENVKKNGIALRAKLKAATALVSDRPAKKAKLSNNKWTTDMTVNDLKADCKARGLSGTGKKSILIQRLEEYHQKELAKTIADCEELGLTVSRKEVDGIEDAIMSHEVDDEVDEPMLM